MLASFLDELAELETIELSGPTELRGVVTAHLTGSGTSAILVCNAAQAAVAVGKRGAKRYGAYVIVGEGSGGWIKGDDADECVAYVAGWFLGRARRYMRDAVAVALPLVPQRGLRSPVTEARLLADELARRSSLRVVRREIERQLLRTLDGEEELTISAGPSGLIGEGFGCHFTVDSARTGLQAAVILGFLDGVSDRSDE